MNFKAQHPNFRLPTKGTERAGAYDLYMPEAGIMLVNTPLAQTVDLGFSAEVPDGYVALILPRSGVGAKQGLELNNTCGVIDSDYRGTWMAALRVKNHKPVRWAANERLLQFILVPVANVTPVLVDHLSDTARGTGGFGSTGQ